MRKRLTLGWLCGVMLLSMLSGCGSTRSGNSDGEQKKIGIAMPAKTLERWNRDGNYLKNQFEKEGYQVILTYSGNVTEQQIEDIQRLVEQKVDLLVIAAIDSESVSYILDEAKDAGIPVISYDRLLRNTDAVSYYVSFDNYMVGKLQGQYIIDALDLENAGDKTYNMEITGGDPGDNNAVYYYNGAIDTLKNYLSAGVIEVPSGQLDYERVGTTKWDTEVAMNRMKKLLKLYYSGGKKTLDIALCSNDSTALGVIYALEKNYHGTNVPLVTGQDADERNLEKMLDGKQAMTVYKTLENEAIVTLELAKQILEGKKPGEELCDVFSDRCEVVYDTNTYDNGVFKVPSYLLKPDVVTKDNYKEILVDTGYYKLNKQGKLKAAE